MKEGFRDNPVHWYHVPYRPHPWHHTMTADVVSGCARTGWLTYSESSAFFSRMLLSISSVGAHSPM